jgi:hypothetical protein
MKKPFLSILAGLLLIAGCGSAKNTKTSENASASATSSVQDTSNSLKDAIEIVADYPDLQDPNLLRYMQDSIYEQVINELGDDSYLVDNVSTKFISKEYLEEMEYNSKENIYFGYTLSELENQFQGKKYVFTVDDDGKTVTRAFEEYDDTVEKLFQNVAIGTGVILICVTVSCLTAGAAPAISIIFATSAKVGTTAALSSGLISGVTAGIVKGIQTNDVEQALKEATVKGSEGFKWGAISGALAGGAAEAVGLYGATYNGLTMDEAAYIQKESKYPLDVIKQIKSMDEYQVYKDAGLYTKLVDGKITLVQNINPDYVDQYGYTNLERMENGNSPLDPTGIAYEYHHIGQKVDSTFAVLTKEQHIQDGNMCILHACGVESVVEHGAEYAKEREQFWMAMAALFKSFKN